MPPLTPTDKARYLANVLSIARAENRVTRPEAVAVRTAARRIGATPEDLAAAKELIGSGDYNLRVLGDKRYHLRNVQDMIMVAIADGGAAQAETKPIEAFSHLLHFSQADMDMAVKRAETELRQALAEAEVEDPKEPPPPPQEQPPEPPPVPPAVPEARPETPDPPTPPAAPKPEEATKKVETAVDKVIRCMAAREESATPRAYCFGAGSGNCNPWGCRFADMDWQAGADWFQLGTFRDDGAFVFDKEAIAERLRSNVSVATECPHLAQDHIDAALEALPPRVSAGERWEYHRRAPAATGTRPVDVVEYVHGIALTRRIESDGVSPIGTREAEKLIQRASRHAGTPLPEMEAVCRKE